MLLRKINAIASLLTTVLLLCHAIFHALWMLSGGSIAISASFMPWILVGLMVIHALISIDLGISAHEGIEKRKTKSYPKLNASTLFQRISGVLLIVFTALHVAGASGYMTPPYVVHLILPPLFFTLSIAHAAVSAGKAFITLGIGSAGFIKAVDVAVKVICVLTLIAAVIGFYKYAL